MKKHGFKQQKDNFLTDEFSSELAPDLPSVKQRQSLSHTDRFDLSAKKSDFPDAAIKTENSQKSE